MKRFRHGLLIGKFYPPHRGHHDVIRQAAAHCEQLSVVVMSSVRETIPLADRVAWVRAEHADDDGVVVTGIPCDAPLDLDDPTVWAAQVAAMRAAIGGAAVDVVVTGEAYGEELASRLDAEWLPIARPADGPSGTKARQDLADHWDDLAPATKAGLATRAVVLGAESTGTTTVARALAAQYRGRGGVWERTNLVEEYGREHTGIIWQQQGTVALDDVVWDRGDFDAVGHEQTRRENAAACTGSPLLVCDTDAFATVQWERRYLGDRARRNPPYAQDLPHHHLYLLTDHDGVPWHDDGMREGDLAVRAAMTDWFTRALTDTGRSWVLLTGTEQQRIGLAIRTVDLLLEHRLRLAAPLSGPGFPADGAR